jgi:hypothetical protein
MKVAPYGEECVRCHNHWCGKLSALAGAGEQIVDKQVDNPSAAECRGYLLSYGRIMAVVNYFKHFPARKGLRALSAVRYPLVSADGCPAGSPADRKPGSGYRSTCGPRLAQTVKAAKLAYPRN